MCLSQSADLNPNEPLQEFLLITHSSRVAVTCRIVRSINAVSVACGGAACENTKMHSDQNQAGLCPACSAVQSVCDVRLCHDVQS